MIEKQLQKLVQVLSG